MHVRTRLGTCLCPGLCLPLKFKKTLTQPYLLNQSYEQQRTTKHACITQIHTYVSFIHGRAHTHVWFWNSTWKIKLIHCCLHGCVSGRVQSKKACKTPTRERLKKKREPSEGKEREREREECDTKKRKKNQKERQEDTRIF